MRSGPTTSAPTPSKLHQFDVLRFMFDPRFRCDPYPLYDRLRARGAVQHTAAAVTTVCSLDTVHEVLRHPAMSSTDHADFTYRAGRRGAGILTEAPFRFVLHRNGAGTRSERPFPTMERELLVSLDPPDHSRIRALVARSFTPRVVTDAEPDIEKIAHELIDRMEPLGTAELLTEFAYQLPVRVICAMLGIPAADYPEFHGWVVDLVKGFDIESLGSRSAMRRADAASVAMGNYLGGLASHRHDHPTDDLISALVEMADDGDRLSASELVAVVVLLLVAGHETTANLIGNSVWLLHLHPEQRHRWVEEPELHRAGIEELLRFESPIQMVQRVATEDLEIGGVPIPSGRIVMPLLGAANRDPVHFERPHHLDLGRIGSHPVPFGFGAHHCIGANLARTEGEIALTTLYTRLPRLRPTIDTARWRSSIVFRGLKALPVTW